MKSTGVGRRHLNAQLHFSAARISIPWCPCLCLCLMDLLPHLFQLESRTFQILLLKPCIRHQSDFHATTYLRSSRLIGLFSLGVFLLTCNHWHIKISTLRSLRSYPNLRSSASH